MAQNEFLERKVLVGVFVGKEDDNFKLGDIVECGYSESSEEGEYEEDSLWCQTWGTWNPLTYSDVGDDEVIVLGESLDWRSDNYTEVSPDLLCRAERILLERSAIA